MSSPTLSQMQKLFSAGALRGYALARFPAEQWQVFILSAAGGQWTVLAELPPEEFTRERDVDNLPAALALCESWILQIEIDEEAFIAAGRDEKAGNDQSSTV